MVEVLGPPRKRKISDNRHREMHNFSQINGNLTVIEDDPWADLDWPYTVSEILVAVAAIVGNSIVILVFGKEKRLRRRTKYYIISLAVADLLVGLLGIPFAILASVGLPRNFYLCLFTVSLLVVLCTISIFCLVAVSIDRYWAILHPMSYSRNVSSRTAIGIIIVCWLAGALVGFLPLLGWRERDALDGKCLFVKVMDYDYLVFLYFATIIIPAILLAAFYTHIYRVVLNQLKQIILLSPRANDHSSDSPSRSSGVMLRMLGAAQKREVKATQNLAIIVLFFIICWIPLYTINCVKAFCKNCDISQTLTNGCIILSHLNSSFNPFLYAYHLKDFRVALRRLIYGNKTTPFHNVQSLNREISIQIHRPPIEIIMEGNLSAESSKSSNAKENDYIAGEKNASIIKGGSEEVVTGSLSNQMWLNKKGTCGRERENKPRSREFLTSACLKSSDDVFAKNSELVRDETPNRNGHLRSRSLQYLSNKCIFRDVRYNSESRTMELSKK